MRRLELFGCVVCGKGNGGLMGLRGCDGNGNGKWGGCTGWQRTLRAVVFWKWKG